jgi:hypothetical protein
MEKNQNNSIEFCYIIGCQNEVEYYDTMDNKICGECAQQMVEEEGCDYNDFEKIKRR